MSTITQAFIESALRHGIVVRPGRATEKAPDAVAYSAAIEMANLGFQVTPQALEGMSTHALTKMIANARKVIGADRNMRPIYPGFPKQVQSLDTLTLILEQLTHYWTSGEFLPNYSDVEREGLPLEDMARATRVLTVQTASQTGQHFIDALTTSPIALPEDEKSLVRASVELVRPESEDIVDVLKRAKNGENKQTLVSAVYNASQNTNASHMVEVLASTSKNPDQLLRLVLAVASYSVEGRERDYERAVIRLSDKDATAVKMNTLSRPARKAVLNRLGELTEGFHADALVSRRNLWRQVLRMMHPYSVPLNADAKRAADIVHANIEHRTFNSAVETGMEQGNVQAVVELLATHQPGNLLRRLVALLRLCSTTQDVNALADAVRNVGAKSATTTLISAYNGVLSVNDDRERVTRVAGYNNSLRSTIVYPKVKTIYVNKISAALLEALEQNLANKTAPTAPVAVVSENAVPLVRRDLATTDRVMDRGEKMVPVGEGDTVRVFSHWRNNQNRAGYMDIGVVILNHDFETLDCVTWNAWHYGRDWATYSGDCNVHPGDEAAEYIDVNMSALRAAKPDATWAAMTIQSWSGFPMHNVDIIAGTMLRSKPDSGEAFDARTVTTAFKPTTEALQAVPLVINLVTGEMVWLDSSSGSTAAGVSAQNDSAVGTVVYDEVARPRLTMGELAALWAQAHNAQTVEEPVDRDTLLSLLG